MEKIAFILFLFFLTGVSSIDPSVGRKFYLIKQGRSWNDAHTYCRSKYVDLATIRSDADTMQIQDEALKQKLLSGAWIGLYNDINSWRWSLRNETLGTRGQWGTLCPNNLGGNRECVSISEILVWEDFPCSSTLPFVCFNESYNGNNRYIFYNNLKTWREAQSYCRDKHTDLTSSRDNSEYSAILGNIPFMTRTWIGLFRDSWKWTDESNISSVRWMAGSPNNLYRNENCGYLTHGQVDDYQCDTQLPFFCYSVKTGQQQIFRVRVQAEQNANDQAAKAAILKQIRQKLEALGATQNVTVKWRAQPDGLVFHKLEEFHTKLSNISNKTCGI